MEEEKERSSSDGEPEGQLTIDVYQTPSEIVVESAIAGVKPEDIDVNATSDSISIKGSRHREKEVKDDDYFYQECYWGRFSRSIILPQEVDPENAEHPPTEARQEKNKEAPRQNRLGRRAERATQRGA